MKLLIFCALFALFTFSVFSAPIATSQPIVETSKHVEPLKLVLPPTCHVCCKKVGNLMDCDQVCC